MVRVVEVDVVRNPEHDLLRRDLQLAILSDIENCLIDVSGFIAAVRIMVEVAVQSYDKKRPNAVEVKDSPVGVPLAHGCT